MQKINYISILRYIQRIIAVREFQGKTFYCNDNELLSGGTVCPLTSGEQVLSLYSFESSLAEDVVTIIGLTIAYRMIAYFILRAFARRHTYQQ